MFEWLAAAGLQIGSILLTFLGLTILIAFHELGHLLAAKLCGMSVSTFSIGFGPALFTKRFGDVEFRFCPILLGGYVRILGMTGIPQVDQADVDRLRAEGRTEEELARLSDQTTWYWNKNGWQQLLTIAAGPAFSFLLGFIMLTAMLGIYGHTTLAEPLKLASVEANSPAAEAGLQAGDEISTINGFPTKNIEDLRKNIAAGNPEMVLLDVKRDGQPLSLVLKPKAQDGRVALGFKLTVISTPVGGPIETLKQGASTAWNVTYRQIEGLVGLVTGKESTSNVSGPVGIIMIGSQSASGGLESMLWFVAVLSIALGIFNLVPVPPLDGGRMVFAAIKAVTGRSVSPMVQGAITALGTIALLILIVLTVFMDAGRM